MINVNAGSLRMTAAALSTMQASEPEIARQSVIAAGRMLKAEVRANLSLTDHSLRDLARMDHPYARRHGSIRVHQERDHVIHTQSGQLLGALHGRVQGGRGKTRGYRVWLDPTQAPHAWYVIEGTRVMLPRDTLWRTAADQRVRTLMMREIVRVMGKGLRTKGVVRFGRTPTPTSNQLGV